jgi:hypothetical protein
VHVQELWAGYRPLVFEQLARMKGNYTKASKGRVGKRRCSENVIFKFDMQAGKYQKNCCSAWPKSKSKEQNFSFGPKQNHPPPKTFKEIPEKLGAKMYASRLKVRQNTSKNAKTYKPPSSHF